MDYIDLILSSPVNIVILLLVVYTLVRLLRNDKIKSIGKDGIIFKDKVEKDHVHSLKKEHNDLSKRISALEESDKKHIETLNMLVNEAASIKEFHKTSIEQMHQMNLALIRLQILSSETSMETKLNLFDEYKRNGGNSYIDLYIDKLTKGR